MKFLIGLVHPVVMAVFFFLLYAQRQLGMQIAGLKERSPEFENRPEMLEKHLRNARILLVIGFLGLVGGAVIAMLVLGVPQPLLHTYGHGFIGLFVLSVLVATYFLGITIKRVIRPKIRQRFYEFHVNMVYIMAVFGLCALATGLWVLIKGPSLVE